jgi:Right handed beta helix region
MPIVAGVMTGSTYVDPRARTNGIGTLQSPYNSFAEASTLRGNQRGFTLFMRSGTVTRASLYIESASNFKIDAYGAGALPLLVGLDAVSGVWRNEGQGTYSMSLAENGQLWVNGRQIVQPAGAVPGSLKKDECAFSGGRMYVNLGGASPAGKRIEVNSPKRQFCLWLAGCAHVTVQHIAVKGAWNNGILADGCGDGVVIQFCKAEYCGNWGTQGGNDGIIVYGSSIKPSAGIVVRGNECNWNWNNAIELWGLQSPIVDSNFGNHNAKGLEFWGFCTGFPQVRNNRYFNNVRPGNNAVGLGIWVTSNATQAPDTGHHGSFTIAGNRLIGAAAGGIRLQDGNNHKIMNNIVLLGAESRAFASCLEIEGVAGSSEVIGNTFSNFNLPGVPQTNLPIVVSAAGTKVLFANNTYWTVNAAAIGNFTLGILAGAYITNFAAWRTHAEPSAKSINVAAVRLV